MPNTHVKQDSIPLASYCVCFTNPVNIIGGGKGEGLEAIYTLVD